MIRGVRRSPVRPPAAQEPGTALDFLRALWELDHAMERASRSMQRRLGVTGPERLFLRIVGQRPGITPAAMAEVLRVHRSSITPLAQKLERRRLVSRQASATDGRSYQLRLTAAGRRIDARRAGTIEEIVRETIARAGAPDVETTAALLVRLARNLTAPLARQRPGVASGRR